MRSIQFRGAKIIDGTGRPSFIGDVTVEDGRIVAISTSTSSCGGPASIDCQGLVLAPGFIDIHSHTDGSVFKNPDATSKLFQGVTLDVTGNCGIGMFPVSRERESQLVDFLRIHDFAIPESGIVWKDFADYARQLDGLPLGINIAPLVGHGPLRIAVVGNDHRDATQDELQEMKRILSAVLSEGAWGLSTGLIYPPGSYAKTEELIELAKVLQKHDAIYTTHLRNEGPALMPALKEAIRIGKESGARVQVSHLKRMGKPNWGQAIEALVLLEQARRDGVNIAADQYPYEASATYLSAVVPQWAHVGGVPALLNRLNDPSMRTRLASDIKGEIELRGGANSVMVTNIHSQRNSRLSGATLLEIGQIWSCTPEQGAIRLILEEKAAVGAIYFSMSEVDVRTILADPNISVGSDGRGLNAISDAASATHPRSYGTFSRVLGRYARDENVLSLETAIHKMTGLPASRVGLSDRGLIKEGYAADITVLDYMKIKDTAHYANPHQYAEGVVHLMVNGEIVISDGVLTGNCSGRVIRKTD